MPLLSRLRRAVPPAVIAALSAAALPAAPTSNATLTASTTPALRINEVLATNTRLANAGTFPDWIELHNAGTAAVDLSGRSLTDDPALPRKFVFPAGTSLPAGGYLTIWADTETTTPGLHTGFALDAEGDQVRLHDTPANGGVLLDSIVFGFQVPDRSVSRTGAGANVWALTDPTPNAANGLPAALAAPAAVRINEWAGKVTYLLDHDMLELFNPATQPVAIGGVRLTDDVARPDRFVFPNLSFIEARGFLPLYGADFVFGLDGDREVVTLGGANLEPIDQVVIIAQQPDRSGGRSPDGGTTFVTYAVPTPGFANDTPLPPAYRNLLDYLRITELMYQPAAPSNASDYEFIELQNVGPVPLDLSGVRFTNGLVHEFDPGTILAPGAFLVVANDRSSFLSRYPGAAGVMARGGYNGSLDNTGENVALSLPAPWRVHILRFRFEPAWYPTASGGGHSLVPVAPATATPPAWQQRSGWRASAAVNGSPGAADPGTPGPTPGPGSRLANLSVRTTLPAGQPLIVGVVVSGGRRDILVRAAGPSLAGFGLAGTMPDPQLQLFQGSTLVVENDNWPAALAPTFATVGAFAFPAGSGDAALVQAVDGARSIWARGTPGGIVLVEAYDTGTTSSPRLINVSARNRVGTGDEILIAGFNLAGTGGKQLLIRAVGPRLAAFGVEGFLADPKLELYTSAGVQLSENDNWAATLAPTFAAVGAFDLAAGSRDAALVTTLNPGSYTVQVRGADGGTGEALVEIYEVP
jgi:hypothetical protein